MHFEVILFAALSYTGELYADLLKILALAQITLTIKLAVVIYIFAVSVYETIIYWDSAQADAPLDVKLVCFAHNWNNGVVEIVE